MLTCNTHLVILAPYLMETHI